MSKLWTDGLALSALGLFAVLWCGGVVVYAIESTRKSVIVSLDRLAVAFGTLLVFLGERLRQREASKP